MQNRYNRPINYKGQGLACSIFCTKLSQVYHLPHKISGYQIDRQLDHEWILRLLVCVELWESIYTMSDCSTRFVCLIIHQCRWRDVHLTLLNSVALIMCSVIKMLCVPRYVWFNSVFSNNKGMSCSVCIALDARQYWYG